MQANFSHLRALLLTGASLVVAGLPMTAAAQTAQAPAADAGVTEETDQIVVTARRTEERLEDVPVAVTAFSPQMLEEQRIVSEVDLQAATAGLTVRQTSSSNNLNFALRGQSIDSFSYSAPSVTTYLNEVQVGGGISGSSFYDFQSVQVLKGPQGTLFGRNATGGAVLYASRGPTETFEGYLRAGLGNFNNTEVQGAINLPIADGFAIRLAGFSQDRDGYQRNLFNGDRLASIDNTSARLSVLFAPPGSNFENVLVYQYGSSGGTNASGRITNAYGINGAPTTYFDPITNSVQPLTTNMAIYYGPGGLNPGAVPGFTDLSDFLTQQASADFYDVYSDRPNTHDARSDFISNTTTYEFSPNLRIRNIIGYSNLDSFDPTDIDGSPYQFLTIGGGPGPTDDGYTNQREQWSEELQLQGSALDGRLDFIVGAFASSESFRQRIPLCIGCDSLFLGFPAGFYAGQYDSTVTDESRAIFAQGTYALTDRLNVTLGARQTWEEVTIENAPDSNLGLLGVVANETREDDNPSWLLGVDFRANADWLVYANYRGSWRTGGFNLTSANSAPNNDAFEPETTWDIELGAKFAGSVFGNPARLNIAVYHQVVEDAQRAPYIGISAVAGNVAEAQVDGVEIDGSLYLTDWLEVGGAYAYTSAEFSDPSAIVGGTEFEFGPYGDAPEHAGSLFFRASHQMQGDLGELALRGDVYSQSSFYYSNLAGTIFPGTQIDGYTLANARLEWNEIRGSDVSFAFYVRNLTDEEYNVGGFPLGAVIGANNVLPGTPRMYGVELNVDF